MPTLSIVKKNNQNVLSKKKNSIKHPSTQKAEKTVETVRYAL